MDLVMGRFADTALTDMSAEDLDVFERLSDVLDGDLYGWITGESVVPPDYDSAVFRRLRAFQFRDGER